MTFIPAAVGFAVRGRLEADYHTRAPTQQGQTTRRAGHLSLSAEGGEDASSADARSSARWRIRPPAGEIGEQSGRAGPSAVRFSGGMVMFLFRRRQRPDGDDLGTAVVLDVETTGLSPRRDEVIELAMILFRFDSTGKVVRGSVEEYVGLREPSIPIPPEATRVHGLTMEDMAGRRLDEKRVLSMARRADYLIAHNARFDRPFVERLLPVAFRRKHWLCTCHDVDWRARGLASKNLAAVARHHRIRHDQAHRALGDARATFALLSLAGVNGGTLLGELLARHKRKIERRAPAARRASAK